MSVHDMENDVAEWREECRAARAAWAQAVADESSTPVINMADARLRRAETRYEHAVRDAERIRLTAKPAPDDIEADETFVTEALAALRENHVDGINEEDGRALLMNLLAKHGSLHGNVTRALLLIAKEEKAAAESRRDYYGGLIRLYQEESMVLRKAVGAGYEAYSRLYVAASYVYGMHSRDHDGCQEGDPCKAGMTALRTALEAVPAPLRKVAVPSAEAT